MINSTKIVVNGKVYTLQHPGNREWLNLKSEMYMVNEGRLNLITLLDYCFEHVVFPEEGKKLDVDTCDIRELEEVWSVLLPQFLRGEIVGEYVYPDDRKSRTEAKKLLAK